jgi:hypothetical protein
MKACCYYNRYSHSPKYRYNRFGSYNNSHGHNGLDVDPFVAAVVDNRAQSVPEPSTLLVALGVVGGWRRRGV